MSDKRCFALTALAAAACSCAGPVRYARVDAPAYSLSIWVDRSPLLDPADALQGCSEWLPKGVVCRLAPDKGSADVAVVLSDEDCVADKEGYRVLARAFRDSHIEFVAGCFRQSGGYDRQMFRGVMTHEIGHVLGIWRHPPVKCDGGAPAGSFERTVCGIAVMNAIYDHDVAFVTVIDAVAFDARSTDDSALQPLGTAPTGAAKPADVPTCTYRLK